MAAYQNVNKNAGMYVRPTRIINMMDVRRGLATTQVNAEEIRRLTPTVEIDRSELDKLLSRCKR